MIRYAAYGSNLHPLRLALRISSAKLVGTGFLRGWTLNFHKRGDDKSAKCNIFAGGDGVHCAIFEISASDKLILDRIEGVGSGYSEIMLSIPEIGDCLSYVAEETHIDDALLPYDWYQELVSIGARMHGFPHEYLKKIESKGARRDPDTNRSVKNWKTVGLIKVNSDWSIHE